MLFQSFLKIYFAFLFASLIFVTTSFSQSTSYLDSLDGKFALQFQINENFSLSDFQGTIFSGKYHFSSRDAVRLGLSVSFRDSERDEIGSRTDTNLVTTSSGDVNNFDITLSAQYLVYLSNISNIGFFIGAGPFLRYENNKYEQSSNRPPLESTRTTTLKSFGVGLDFISGVEWMFHKSMSLSAEYGLRFIYTSHESTDDNKVFRQERNEDSYIITGNHVKFGITVYF